MIHSLAIIALLAAPVATPAPKCVTKRQVADAAMTITPYLVEAVIEKCRAHVPAGSFLAAKGDAFHTRLKAEGAGREASAAQVLMTAMGDELPAMKDTKALITVIGAMASGFMAKDLPVESCGEIGGMMEALSPLPAENIGQFAASAAALLSSSRPADAADPANPDDLAKPTELGKATDLAKQTDLAKPGVSVKPGKGMNKFEICKDG